MSPRTNPLGGSECYSGTWLFYPFLILKVVLRSLETRLPRHPGARSTNRQAWRREVRVDTSPKDMTTLLGELSGGKPEALANLVPVLYSELRRLASHFLQQERVDHTLQGTALVR